MRKIAATTNFYKEGLSKMGVRKLQVWSEVGPQLKNSELPLAWNSLKRSFLINCCISMSFRILQLQFTGEFPQPGRL
jgi:hypothetical protein